MNNNLEKLPTEKLRAMMQQCWQTINANLDRLNDSPEMQPGIWRLMNAENMRARDGIPVTSSQSSDQDWSSMW
ncbi:MAG: hypothetical protein WKF77_23940 [Planctomycetaceae bacterium]